MKHNALILVYVQKVSITVTGMEIGQSAWGVLSLNGRGPGAT